MFGIVSARIAAILERMQYALTNEHRRDRAVLLLLVAYVVAWTLYATIAKSSQDIHFDSGEALAWARESPFGNMKHPPLSAWPPALWFSVFPRTDWAYYALGIVLAAVALWAAWRISEKYLTPEKRLAGLAMLTLVPFYNFHALKYNVNLVMLPLWALTTWAFVRSYETRRILPAVLAGLAAAGAMLGKYWSVMLLAGLAIAALVDTRRWQYFRSPAPWVTIAVGLAVLIPHFVWLHENTATVAYALSSHPGTLWRALRSELNYLVSSAAYAVVPLILTALIARPTAKILADMFWPPEAERRFIVVALFAPLLLPLIAAVATESVAVSLWGIGGMTLLPIVLLSSPYVKIPEDVLRRILAFAVAFPLLALLASPIVAVLIHSQGLENNSAHYRLVAQAVEREWRLATKAPLNIFGSYENLLFGSVFYFAGQPKTLEITRPEMSPWTTEQDIARDGIALACPAMTDLCMKKLEAFTMKYPAARRTEVEFRRRHFGIDGAPEKFVIVVIPPP